jgi:hypothetical protein
MKTLNGIWKRINHNQTIRIDEVLLGKPVSWTVLPSSEYDYLPSIIFSTESFRITLLNGFEHDLAYLEMCHLPNDEPIYNANFLSFEPLLPKGSNNELLFMRKGDLYMGYIEGQYAFIRSNDESKHAISLWKGGLCIKGESGIIELMKNGYLTNEAITFLRNMPSVRAYLKEIGSFL